MTESTFTYRITGDHQSTVVSAKKNYLDSTFRFRFRVKANSNERGSSKDDDDTWYIDHIMLDHPNTPGLEVKWVHIITPYTKIPFSATVALPVYVRFRNY